MSTTPRKTRKPRSRTLSFNGTTGILHIKQGELEVGYYLDAIATALGRAFRLTKIVTPADGTGAEYDVLISPDGFHTCECKGHLRHGVECKHIAALRCLAGRGSI